MGKGELNFTALTEDEVKRAVFVHPEDEDLDLQPTLFQQFMGDFGKDEESEEEDEDTGKKKAKADKAKTADKSKGKDLGPRVDNKEKDDSDSDDADDGKKTDDKDDSS